MPDGPYDLWRGDEKARRVKDMVGAFAQFAKLPKMLRHREILNTIVQGIEERNLGRAHGCDPTGRTRAYWRTRIDDSVMREPSLEVCLPKSATLSDLNPALLACDVLPELWPAGEISVQSVHDYFVRCGHSVLVPMEGYEGHVFHSRV